MGERNDGLAPGQLWPSDLAISPAREAPSTFVTATGHTAIVVSGILAEADEAAELHRLVKAHSGTPVFDFDAEPAAGEESASSDPAIAERLGVRGVTLFVVRPDGYLGLRADGHHADALDAYAARLG